MINTIMNLWLFGDSFANNAGRLDCYAYKILKEIDFLENIVDCGYCATALQYTYEQWENHLSEFTTSDIAIVVLTSLERRYFFQAIPGWSYPNSIDSIKNYSVLDEQKQAFEFYWKYLRRSEEEKIVLINFLYALNASPIKTIVLPGFVETEVVLNCVKNRFPNLTIASGNLNSISISEICTGLNYPNLQEDDRRTNHLCKSNHAILAGKIVDFIKNQNEIDLNNGFLKNIVSRDKLNNAEWRKQELDDPTPLNL